MIVMSSAVRATKQLVVAALRRYHFNREALNVLFTDKDIYRAREVLDLLEKIGFQESKREFLGHVGYTDNDAIIQTLVREGKL